jgi:hypothetical protein
MSRKAADGGIVAGVLTLVALSFVAFLNKPLVSDDHYLLSPAITAHPLIYFARDMLPQDPAADFLRPIPILAFALDARLRGTIPHIFNYANLFWHMANVAIVGLLIVLPFRAAARPAGLWAPVAAMLFFGLHPQNVGAVCWVSARFDLMCAAFGMGGLCLWLGGSYKANTRPLRIGAVVCFVLSLLSKETGIVFLGGIFAWELWRLLRYRRTVDVKEQLIALCWPAGLLALYFIYRITVLGGIGGYQVFHYAEFSPGTAVGWIMVMLWPLATLASPPAGLISWILIIAAAGIVFMTRHPEQQNDGAARPPWALPAFVVVLWLLFQAWCPMVISAILRHIESRYSYIPLVVLAVIIGWALQRLRLGTGGRMAIRVVIAAVLALAIVVQQAEIAKWKRAGLMAEDILDQTVALVPHPPQNATMLFPDAPLYLETGYYVFGMGLKEALDYRYQRDDLKVIEWPDQALLDNPPLDSYIFRFDPKTCRMTLTRSPER